MSESSSTEGIGPHVLSVNEMSTSEAKWITLNKIEYKDGKGNKRVWESASRRTRKSIGIDAVAIFTILRSASGEFPPSTIIIEQYRPPVDAVVIEMPAGLIDDGETAEQAAIRELQEETGYKVDSVLDVSPVVVADPGMTNANMQLVTVSVTLQSGASKPEQMLDSGEEITVRTVPIDKLSQELKEYDKKGFVVDAKLAHLAAGLDLARQFRDQLA